jgi:hypothetical protein
MKSSVPVAIDMVRLPFTPLHKKILSTESSPLDPPSARCASGHMCAHVYQRTHVVSERSIGLSSKLLDIFKQVKLLWVYMVVDMKYSR